LENKHVMPMPENFHYIVYEGYGHFSILDESTVFSRMMIDFMVL